MRSLTFSDIKLLPQLTDILPEQISLKTTITKNGFKLNIPVLSAAMDTVTDHKLAIVLARLGGLGIIHRAFSIEEQAAEVKKVKSETWFMIQRPRTINALCTVRHAKAIMESEGISGIPMVAEGKPVGIITKRDVKFISNLRLDWSVTMEMAGQTLIVINQSEIKDEKRIKEIFHTRKIEKLPVVDDNGILVGLITSKDFEKRNRYPQAILDNNGCLMVGAAIGVGEKGKERAEVLIKAGADLLVVDSAHGNSATVRQTVKAIKEMRSDIPLIAGNVVTVETARALINEGADAVKVGVGPGSVCTTSDVTGIGRGQITAIRQCLRLSVPIIADGGLRYYGDIAKALACGASAVMSGSFFAGTDETPGNVKEIKGRFYKEYRGMGSAPLIGKIGFDRYLQDKVPEGVEIRVDYKGAAEKVIIEMVNALKSALADLGCESIKKLHTLDYNKICEEISGRDSLKERFHEEFI